MVHRALKALIPLTLLAASALMPACQTYHAPPEARIVGTSDNVLKDPSAPIVLAFTPEVNPRTLKLKIIRYVADPEGNLVGEDAPENVLFRMDGANEPEGGKVTWGTPAAPADGGTAPAEPPPVPATTSTLSIALKKTPPVGPRLAIVIEPGSADADGNATVARRTILFGYEFKCSDKGIGTTFPSGAYFFLLDLKVPLPTQIQILGWLDVDPSTGKFHGQFTNADRIADPNRCPTPCSTKDACRLYGLPEPKCVTPSERAGTAEEYPDWIPNPTPPIGYSFTVDGCAEDVNGSTSFAIVPADVIVQSPAVTVKGITLSASFEQKDGVFRGQGSASAALVYIGTAESGQAQGTMQGRSIPPAEAPANIPRPPPK